MRLILPLVQPDLDGSAGWLAGLHYVRHCVRALLASGELAGTRLVVVRHEQAPVLLEAPEGGAVQEVLLPRPEPGTLLDLDQRLGAQAGDVLFPMSSLPAYASSAAAVGWIPDFQHRRLPELFPPQERLDRDRQQAFIVARSERVVCSSQAVREDFLAAFPAAADKAAVVPFAVDVWGDLDERAEAPATRDLPRAFAYLPNQFWVHKNHRLVLQAWRLLARAGLRVPLLCTGAAGDHRRPEHYAELRGLVEEWGLGDLVRFLGVVPRPEQLALYRRAAFVLQPSLFEGWSTSVEEARSLGRRVLASAIPVLREQAPEGTLFFDPQEPEELALRVRQAWQESSSWSKDEDEARAESRGRVREFGRRLAAVVAAAAAGRGSQAERACLANVGLLWRAELAVAEQDRAARLHVIEGQGAELGRLRGLEPQVSDLEGRLAVAEQDRAARLRVIEEQGAELGRLRGLEPQVSDLEQRLRACEADRATRLRVIEEQGAELGRLGGRVGELEHQLAASEADRAARLRVIEEQGAELGRLRGLEQQVADLERRLAESETDRAARLRVIEEQGAELARLAALLDALAPRPVLGLALPGEIRRLRALLSESRTRLSAFLSRRPPGPTATEDGP